MNEMTPPQPASGDAADAGTPVPVTVAFGDGIGPSVDAIAFGAYDSEMGQALERHGGARFHLAGRLDINTWGGRQTVQLRLEDAALAV